jgi:hypothetical protein
VLYQDAGIKDSDRAVIDIEPGAGVSTAREINRFLALF